MPSTLAGGRGNNNREAEEDDGWQQYGNFMEVFMVHLTKSQPSLSNLLAQLKHKLASSAKQSSDFAAILTELHSDAALTTAIAAFCDELFPLELIRSDFSKNNHEAVKYLRAGEQCFQSGDNERAIYNFSLGLKYAEDSLEPYSFEDGQSFADLVATLYDRRSAAFLKSDQPYEAMLDLEELFRLAGDHKPVSPSAVLRLAHAISVQKDFANLSKLLSMQSLVVSARDRVQLPPAHAKKLATYCAEIDSIVAKLRAHQPSTSSEIVDDDPGNELEALLGHAKLDPHPTIRGASAKVALECTEDKGRYIVAAAPIEKGDKLFEERPYSANILSELHCANCFVRLGYEKPVSENSTELTVAYHFFIPCTSCNKFIFCSDQCRRTAYDRFHRAECHRKMFALEPQLGISYIVLRTILVAGGPAAALCAANSAESSTKGDYQAVLGLLAHPTKHDDHSNALSILTAMFLLHVLQRFEIVKPAEVEPVPLLSLLLHHIQQLSTNLVTIFEQGSVDNVDSTGLSSSALAAGMPPSKELTIGVGFYPTIALLNHSCDPDLVPLYIGSKLVLKAARPLAPGQEISFSYGPTYRNSPLIKRQKTLAEQYFFNCRCSACLERKENYDEALLCTTCNGPAFLDDNKLVCSRADHINTQVADILEAIEQATSHLTAADTFLDQFAKKEDSADVIAGLVAAHKADVKCSEHLFALNSLLLRTKRTMIDCYLKMGHYDRAEAYARQLTRTFAKYLIDDLRMPLAQEQLRLVKILILRVEEIMDEEDDKENSSGGDGGETIRALCPQIEAALNEFEQSLAHFRETSGEAAFGHMFSKEIEFVREKRSWLQDVQSQMDAF